MQIQPKVVMKYEHALARLRMYQAASERERNQNSLHSLDCMLPLDQWQGCCRERLLALGMLPAPTPIDTAASAGYTEAKLAAILSGSRKERA